MRIRLPDGTDCNLSEMMCRHLATELREEELGGALVDLSPSTARALKRRGLVYSTGRRGDRAWALTRRGRLVVGECRKLWEKRRPPERLRPVRPSLDPSLTRKEADALLKLEEDPAAGWVVLKGKREDAHGSLLFAVVAVLVSAAALALLMVPAEEPGVLLGLAYTAAFFGLLLAPTVIYGRLLNWSDQVDRIRELRCVLPAQPYEGWYITGGQLDASGAHILARAQRAVDEVLDLPPHHMGLLFDGRVDRTSLAESEWRVAVELTEQRRRRMGMRFGSPECEREREALDAEAARTERRVRVLEGYARRARMAGRGERLLAGEEAARVACTAHDLHDEELSDLVRSQEQALRTAGLLPERG